MLTLVLAATLCTKQHYPTLYLRKLVSARVKNLAKVIASIRWQSPSGKRGSVLHVAKPVSQSEGTGPQDVGV